MILDVIVEDKKQRLLEQKKQISHGQMQRMAEAVSRKGQERSFYRALKKPEISIIGEFKRASPSLGAIEQTMDLTERIGEYNQSVDAISCLTEETHFLGNREYFEKIRRITNLPMLRKDFMIDTYQFYEAKVMGADAVLLIAAILDDMQLRTFYGLSKSLGLDVLVEVHDEVEMERALKLDAKIIGVNNRNLKDFSIHLDTTKRLRTMVSEDKVFVAESGITNDLHVNYLKECKVDAFLIGRAFMESHHPMELARKWKESA